MGNLKRKQVKIEHLTAAFYRRFIMSQFVSLTFDTVSGILNEIK